MNSSPESNSGGTSPKSRIHKSHPKRPCAQNESLKDEHEHFYPAFSQRNLPSDQKDEVNTRDKSSTALSQTSCHWSQSLFKPGNPFRDMARVLCPKLPNAKVYSQDDQVIQRKSSDDLGLDDSSILEFSNLRLKLKSPIKSPETNTSPSTARVDLQEPGVSVKPSPGMIQNETPTKSELNSEHVLLPRKLSSGQSLQMHPTSMSETVHHLPQAMQSLEIHQPEIWPNRSCISINKSPAVPPQSNWEPGQTLSDGYLGQIPSTTAQIYEQLNIPSKTEVQSNKEDLQYESFNLQPSSSSAVSLANPLQGVDSSTEVLLSPAALPQIAVQSRPAYEAVPTTYFGIKSALPVSDYTPGVSASMPPPVVSEPLPPPPPYSECVDDQDRSPSLFDQKRRLKTGPPRYCEHFKDVPSYKPNGTPKFNGGKNLYCISDYTRFSRQSYGSSHGVDPQDSPTTHQRMEPPTSDHQALAFVSCLFCWPIGLVAIYYSNMCHILKSEGDNEQAHTYARLAFIASLSALCSGVVGYIIMFFYERGI